MKKQLNNKNLKFMALMLLMTTGCAHKNIVKDARFDRLTLQDMKTGKESVYDCSNSPKLQSVLMWLAPGDTVNIKSISYASDTIFTPENSHFSCDYAEMQRRQDAFEREKIRQKVNAEFARQKSK